MAQSAPQKHPHQSFYRTHRPASFKDVVGQEQVTKPLQSQVEGKTVGHAYLFSGSRGLGKTSVARIFARELGATEKDIYEIDAASNNTVEDIRQLTENVYTMPFESPYKVYILDEAHMLSKSAWNAFLKTLEEPPAHAIFILATTELDKVPDTVLSRCQVFTFKRPTREGLSKVITDVARKEGYSIEPSASDLIAHLSEGSYRDALSILERVCAASSDKKVTRAETEEATGAPKAALVESLAKALSEGNQETALGTISTLESQNIDIELYLSLVLEFMRSVLLIRHAPELRRELETELGADEYSSRKALAEAKDSKLTHKSLKLFLDAASRLRYAPVPALALELAIYELFSEES